MDGPISDSLSQAYRTIFSSHFIIFSFLMQQRFRTVVGLPHYTPSIIGWQWRIALVILRINIQSLYRAGHESPASYFRLDEPLLQVLFVGHNML